MQAYEWGKQTNYINQSQQANLFRNVGEMGTDLFRDTTADRSRRDLSQPLTSVPSAF